MCSGFQRDDCVIDGDTIRLNGRKIRLADINAPEKSAPQCAYEKQLADQATKRLLVMLNEGPVVLRAVDRDQDRYGRDLRVVLVNGRSVGSRLVDEGLAETWTGRRRNWC
ncbi:thermonuclease family protein [Aquisediminimonas sediminicola]|uniref:thermonuclease family protein n=1 Tax=Alteraquisediminimonas sediminicola TaxID=2676787 RepID=UPI001FE926B0|nr:thermonuclease family protein [Aquisediminimonas sediminicola]